jgi:hypothetical protein
LAGASVLEADGETRESSILSPPKGVNMKIYKYDEWDFEWENGREFGGYDDRIYVDLDGNLLTGILEGFHGYTAVASDEKNCQYVENGKIRRN